MARRLDALTPAGVATLLRDLGVLGTFLGDTSRACLVGDFEGDLERVLPAARGVFLVGVFGVEGAAAFIGEEFLRGVFFTGIFEGVERTVAVLLLPVLADLLSFPQHLHMSFKRKPTDVVKDKSKAPTTFGTGQRCQGRSQSSGMTMQLAQDPTQIE